ncbi:hypothetical protein ACFXPS_24690 [Nocardia sp. NPDC059091]|uniref:hypothetical protein n=1 Tax=unclassified Nocardia TaxID=2637762 RepID=UPI0036A8756A
MSHDSLRLFAELDRHLQATMVWRRETLDAVIGSSAFLSECGVGASEASSESSWVSSGVAQSNSGMAVG